MCLLIQLAPQLTRICNTLHETHVIILCSKNKKCIHRICIFFLYLLLRIALGQVTWKHRWSRQNVVQIGSWFKGLNRGKQTHKKYCDLAFLPFSLKTSSWPQLRHRRPTNLLNYT